MVRSPQRVLRGSIVAASFVFLTTMPVIAAVHPGDLLNVRVANHVELSSDVKVDAHGSIQIPLAGSIRVAGRESSDVARLIAARLAPYIRFPSVDVRDTTEATGLFVAGGPGGVLPFSPGETLSTALADVEKELQQHLPATANTSSNVTDEIDRSRIDLRRVAIIRDGKRLGTWDMQALRRVGDPGPALNPDDTISFADKPVSVTILGDVEAPGKAYLWSDEALSDAIAQTGGVKDTAATGQIEFSRDGESPRLIALGDRAFTAPAMQGDIVIIPTAPRVTVAGMVYTPGVTTLRNNFTLLSAMYSAGGIQKWANLTDVQVTHQGATTHYNITNLTHGDQTQNPSLSDGDVVFVPEGHKIDFSSFFGPLLNAGSVLIR